MQDDLENYAKPVNSPEHWEERLSSYRGKDIGYAGNQAFTYNPEFPINTITFDDLTLNFPALKMYNLDQVSSDMISMGVMGMVDITIHCDILDRAFTVPFVVMKHHLIRTALGKNFYK